jgi:hypothetical protein
MRPILSHVTHRNKTKQNETKGNKTSCNQLITRSGIPWDVLASTWVPTNKARKSMDVVGLRIRIASGGVDAGRVDARRVDAGRVGAGDAAP